MSTDHVKEILSAIAAFIAGFGPAYFASPDPKSWPGWVVAGLVSAGAYIGGYVQTNPRLQPVTSTQLLESVKKSEMTPAMKAKLTPILATEAAKTGPADGRGA